VPSSSKQAVEARFEGLCFLPESIAVVTFYPDSKNKGFDDKND
jgi:hypothetical protein